MMRTHLNILNTYLIKEHQQIFILIGATTREPSEINPALRSRCTEVYFQPLTPTDIEK